MINGVNQWGQGRINGVRVIDQLLVPRVTINGSEVGRLSLMSAACFPVAWVLRLPVADIGVQLQAQGTDDLQRAIKQR